MSLDALLFAARILQAQPGYSMPLVHLHARLVRELGVRAGSYGEIYQALRKRTDSFAIVDAPRVLGGIDNWPGAVREAYDSALEQAGLGSCVRVVLTETPVAEGAGLLAALSFTLAELAHSVGADRALAGYLERGALEVDEIARIMQDAEADHPTTLLPGPPPTE